MTLRLLRKRKRRRAARPWQLLAIVATDNEITRSLPFRQMLKRMGFPEYRDYLKSGLWKQIRARILARRPNCIRCQDPASQVHHADYRLEVMRGYADECLHPVCRDCHKLAEFDGDRKRTLQEANAFLGL